MRILSGLQSGGVNKGGELILQIDHIESFISVFWACILGGIIPVPVTVGNNEEHRLKVFRIWEKLSNPYMVTTPATLEALNKYAVNCGVSCDLKKMKDHTIMLSQLEASIDKGQPAKICPDDIAFIQFSSGSTGFPKGVILTHRNLTSNISAIIRSAQITSGDSTLSWMPLTHDMGLIGFHLAPLLLHLNQYIMPTGLFIRHPGLWMDKACKHRITLTASPNFGYQYFLKTSENKEYDWDLSNIRLIFNGAEPISVELCERFMNSMKKYGLKKNTMYPVYGLAEASLAVAFSKAGDEIVSVNIDRGSLSIGSKVRISVAKSERCVTFADLGYPVDFCDIRICDEQNNILDDHMVGYVQIKGENVTKGYYNDADITANTITADGWLNTGDLGFIRNGRLVITGRAKDVIFVNGQNYYAHDIERVAVTMEGVGLGEIVAGSSYDTETGRDVIILFVLYKKPVEMFIPLASKLKKHIRRIMGLEIDCVIPVKKIPKTTSGKIERYRLIENFENNAYDKILKEISALEKESVRSDDRQDCSNDNIEETLLLTARNVFGTDSIGIDDNLIELGGNSILLTNVHSKLDEMYPGKIKISDLFTYPSIRELTRYIREQVNYYANADVIHEGACSYVSDSSCESIAIIGIAASLPVADELDEFWNGICNGACFTTRFPESRRYDIEKYLEFIGEKDTSIRFFEGAFLKNIDQFDYSFFRISHKEASLMNPSQRMILETVFHAVEDSGYGGDKLKGKNIGIYAGQISDSEFYKYKEMIHNTEPESLPISAAGNISALIPNRISYILDVKGPSMVIDTACSSSLVALHIACQAIRNGDCDAAVVGSARINYIPIDKEYYRIGIESSDYMTRVFDKHSDGSGIGEGVIAVVIKPLSKALADKDNIYAVIKGSAVNQDGASMGITVPNAELQSEVLVKAWKNAGIDPETLSWIEAHGTGTKIGDVIEIEGLQRAMSKFTSKKQFCAIGSVKSNLGHLYESAGLAGLLKAVISLKNREIPPSAEFIEPNDKIDFTQTAFYVNTRPKSLKGMNGPIRCGISSFGIGGTNCHVVLEEAPKAPEPERREDVPYVLTLSAKKLEALQKLVCRFESFLSVRPMDDDFLGNVCFTANTGRGHHSKRLAVLFDDYRDLCRKISALTKTDLTKTDVSGVYFGETDPDSQLHDIDHLMEMENRKARMDEYAAGLTARFAASGATDSNLLQEICRLYVNGANIDWDRIYRNKGYARVSLPVYPFDRKRCWINIPEAVTHDNVFYSVDWKVYPLQALPAIDRGNPEQVLIMKDDSNYGDRLAEELSKRNADVVSVKWGEASYEELARKIKDNGIKTVLYLFTYGRPNPDDEESLSNAQDRGVIYLFGLIRALLRLNPDNIINFVIISDFVYQVTGTETELKPENAPLFGFAKVAGIESSKLRCKCLDVDDVTDIGTIAEEISAANTDTIVAYRRGVRYVEELAEMDQKQLCGKNAELKSEGVYVITGGLGGIGMEIAKRMASRKRVNIALVSRSRCPDEADWDRILQSGTDKEMIRRISYLREIKKSGSNVVILSADIARYTETAAVIDGLKQRFGRINGVIHAAGIAGSGLIINKDIDMFRQVLLPKICGTWAIDKATGDCGMDFFALFSSALTLAGDIGQSDYVAANAYLDAFAASRNLRQRGTTVFDWVDWSEVGMACRHGFKSGGYFRPLRTRTGLDAFERLIGTGVQRAVIGEIDTGSCRLREMAEKGIFHVSDQIVKRLAPNSDDGSPAADSCSLIDARLTGRKKGDYTDTERIVAALCKKVLGFDEVNIHDSFFELGADSILLKRIYLLLDERYPGKLSVTDLFAYTSIYRLAAFLDGNAGNPAVPNKEDALIEQAACEDCQEEFSIDDALEYISKL